MTLNTAFTFCLVNIVLLTMVTSTDAIAQKKEPETIDGVARHRITIMMANSHIPSANRINGQSTVFIVPTWGLNYDYWLSEKWAIGLHNDIVLQHYKIEKSHDKEVIERVNPVTLCTVALYRPLHNWTFLLGIGRELEKNESFTVLTAGSEYGVELPGDWELSFNIIYDNKLETYDTWMFGVGFSKLF